jgi:hypothetical protein
VAYYPWEEAVSCTLDFAVFDADNHMFDPVTWVDELETLPLGDQRAIMGGNLAKLMGVDPAAKVIRH